MVTEITIPSRCYPGMLAQGGRVLSLSAGVQSTVLAEMIMAGQLPPVDTAIFADTGDERPETMAFLDDLERRCHNSFPLIRVKAGDMIGNVAAQARGEQKTGAAATPPFWVAGKGGRAAPLRRQCTQTYKLEPILQGLRHLIGVARGRRVPSSVSIEMLVGLTVDEFARWKPDQQAWIKRSYPLIDAGMSRGDCVAWLQRQGLTVPVKSACVCCPYRSNEGWRRMRLGFPLTFERAVEIDRDIRPGFRGTRGEVFVHRSLLPLPDAIDATDDQHYGDLFSSDCTGICGT